MRLIETDPSLEKILPHPAAGGRESPDPVLLHHDPGKVKGEIIGKLASSCCHVRSSARVVELADALKDREDLLYIGVTDDEDRALGLIIRREFFSVLGQPYGRDLYRDKSVLRLMKETGAFNFYTNLFSVTDLLAPVLHEKQIRYYLLTDDRSRFRGIFSTRDMLVYLSHLMTRDLDLAKRLQTSIVREETLVERETFSALGATRMAKGVGGDFYQMRKHASGRWIIALCDVSGKGISASLISTTIGGMFSVFDFSRGLEEFVVRLNEYLFATFETEKFVTGVFLDFNEDTGDLLIFDMGHSFHYLYRHGKMHRMRSSPGNIPLGISGDLTPKPGRFRLQKGDMAIIVTDGIEEQTDPEGREYDIRGLPALIRHHRPRGLKRIKEELFADIDRFRRGHPKNDDMTLVLLDYHG